jgi:PII-like signaling protein
VVEMMAVRTPGVEFCRLRAYLDDADRTDDQPMFEFVVDLILSIWPTLRSFVGCRRPPPDRDRRCPCRFIVEAIGPRYRINSIVTRARRIIGDRLLTIEHVEIVG